MAHDLNKTNGKENMMYVGEVPWHGLGTRLDKPATAAEAIAVSGLDYEVEKRDVLFKKEDGTIAECDGKSVAVRKDTEQALGVIGDRYSIIQNGAAFGFFDSVVGEDLAMYHTAGALGAGERVWILAQLPERIVLANDRDDVTEQYLLFTNSHDGRMSCRMFFTPVRVVCQNTLTRAVSNAHHGISIRHTGDIEKKVAQAREALGFAHEYYMKMQERADWLSRIEINEDVIAQYLSTLYPLMPDATVRTKNRVERVHADVTTRFEAERGRTMWHLANAAVEYIDHGAAFRGTSRFNAAETRFNSVTMGAGAEMKARVFEEATRLATITV